MPKIIAYKENMMGDGRLFASITLRFPDGYTFTVCHEIDY